jgi:hypothetical protein
MSLVITSARLRHAQIGHLPVTSFGCAEHVVYVSHHHVLRSNLYTSVIVCAFRALFKPVVDVAAS